MELLSLIFTIVSIVITFISIGITIFGVVIPIQHERKSKLPRLVLSHFIFGDKPDNEKDKQDETVLHGYFQLQRDFDKRLHEFLLSNDCDIKYMTNNFMHLIVESYNNKDYYEKSQYHPTMEVNKIIMTFKDNPRFKKLINEYEAYMRNSRWCLDITNVGQTSAYNFTIDLFRENNGFAKYSNKTLETNSVKKIVLYYFDSSAEVDYINKSLCWKNENNTIFYLVNEKKYNKKDERLFLITYKDIYDKCHKVYCCSRVGKNNFHNIMGAK